MDDVKTVIHRHNDGQGTLSIQTLQDCTPIAELCKTQQREGVTGTSEMKLAARIPDVMVTAYCNNNNITFSEFINNREHVRRIVNDPAMAHFRVWQGRI